MDPKRAPNPEPAPAYVYHWDRIIGALSALLVLIGLLGYGLYSWLSPPLPASSDVLEQAQTRDETVGTRAGRDSDADDNAAADTAPVTAAEPTESLEQTTPDRAATPPQAGMDMPIPDPDSGPSGVPAFDPATSRQTAGQTDRIAIAGLADATSPSGNDPVAIAAGEAIAIPQAADRDGREMREPTPTQTAEMPSAADASESVAGAAPEQPSDIQASQNSAMPVAAEPEPSRDRSVPPKTTTTSPAVVRFQLAQSVVGNEPRGDLGDIRASAKGSALVSSFSEVTGLQGDVLHYRWLHEGKEVLRIRVPVRANRWRSHSEKRIQPGMEGSWRVELLDSKGTLLGTIDFVY